MNRKYYLLTVIMFFASTAWAEQINPAAALTNYQKNDTGGIMKIKFSDNTQTQDQRLLARKKMDIDCYSRCLDRCEKLSGPDKTECIIGCRYVCNDKENE